MLLDLVQLRTFVVVAEEQHLQRAAERLHISQSAASAHVRAVEEKLEAQLFLRTNRLELTRAGQILLQQCKALLNEATRLSASARELKGKMEGHLVVGSSAERGTRIGEVVAALRACHPLVGLDLRARTSIGARQGLKSGELDIGILVGRGPDPGFTSYDLMPVSYRVAGPAQWKTEIRNATWAELAALPWITPNRGTASSMILADFFTSKGLEVNSVAQFDSAEFARALLSAGVGLMLMRTEEAEAAEAQGLLVVSPIARADVKLMLAHRSSSDIDPLIQAFVQATAVAWPEMRPSGIEAPADTTP